MAKKTKDGETFDQAKYMQEWSKKNMALVSARYKKEFVEEYRNSLKKLNLTNSDVIRNMMNEIIEKAKKEKL